MIERRYNILDLLNNNYSLFILGPRGSGKSSFINSFLDRSNTESFRINLLSTSDYTKYLINPSQLTVEIRFKISSGSKKLLVLIDEIQLLPQLLNEVHLLIEEQKEKLIFILTGSSARKLKRNDNSNLLAGRAININFFPISHLEFDFDNQLNKILRFGSLPKVLTESREDLIEEYLKTYAHTYIKEEIQQESVVRNLPAFSKFLELAAQYNGQHINFSKLAKTISVSANTLKTYFSILEETLLIKPLYDWTHSIKTQLIKAPKFYFFDNGVLRTLTGELRSELNERSLRYGAMFENLVINEIFKYNSLNRLDNKFYTFRTTSNQEIDLIIQRSPFEPPKGIEIKSDTNPSAKDVKALYLLKEANPEAKLFVLCRCSKPYEDQGIQFWPFIDGIKEILSD